MFVSNSITLKSDHPKSNILSERSRNRDILREQKRHDRLFTDAWELMNQEKWKKNQKIAHERRERIQRFHEKQLTRFQSLQEKKRTNELSHTFQSINQFDNKLDNDELLIEDKNNQLPELVKTICINPNASDDDSNNFDPNNSTTLTYINQDYLNTQLINQNTKLFQQKYSKINSISKFEQKRLKFLSKQENFIELSIANENENIVKSESKLISLYEDFENELKDSILINQKALIVENARNREKLIHEIQEKEMFIDEAKWQEEIMSREINWIVSERVSSSMDRVNVLDEAITSSYQVEITDFVLHDIIDRTLDIVDFVCSYRSLAVISNTEDNSTLIPTSLWNDVISAFTAPYHVTRSFPDTEALIISLDLPYTLSKQPLCFQNKDSLLFSTDNFFSDGQLEKFFVLREVENQILTISSYVPSDTAFLEMIQPEPIEQNAKSMNPKLKTETKKQNKSDNEPTEMDLELAKRYRRDFPKWMISTPPIYIFGETMLTLKQIVCPIPDPPCVSEQVPSELPIRAAILGVSEKFRWAVAVKIAQQKSLFDRLRIISLQELLDEKVKIVIELEKKENEDIASWERDLMSDLSLGHPISDIHASCLIIEAIVTLDTSVYDYGYILVDYPNTKEQLNELFKCLSNIDYESHRIQIQDYYSKYLRYKKREIIDFDSLQCGLNLILNFTVTPPESPIETNILISSKTRFNRLTNREVILDKTMTMEGLCEVYSPLESIHLISISCHEETHHTKQMLTFINKLFLNHENSILRCVNVSYEEMTNAELVVDKVYKSLLLPLLPLETQSHIMESEYESNDIEGLRLQIPDMSINDEESNSSKLKIVNNELLSSTEVIPSQVIASTLSNLWNCIESQSDTSWGRFCKLHRDTIHHMSQYRRILYDYIQLNIIKCRDFQKPFNELQQYILNDIDIDMLFDDNIKGELLLRVLELQDEFIHQIEIQKNHCINELKVLVELPLDTIDNKISKKDQLPNDTNSSLGFVNSLIHRLQCEGAFVIQTELNRFSICIDIIMDFFKVMQPFDSRYLIANPLDETTPFTTSSTSEVIKPKVSTIGGNKKTSNIPLTNSRNPITLSVLAPVSITSSIPRKGIVISDCNIPMTDSSVNNKVCLVLVY